MRPTEGLPQADQTFTVLPTPEYDPDDEVWEFVPGTLVRCRKELQDGEEFLVASERVDAQ
jgi:hypothetical protein